MSTTLFNQSSVGHGSILVPAAAPMRHFVRWSPAERLAFLPDGRRSVAVGVVETRERCPVCRAPVVHTNGTAQEDPDRRFRAAVTPTWCCLRGGVVS